MTKKNSIDFFYKNIIIKDKFLNYRNSAYHHHMQTIEFNIFEHLRIHYDNLKFDKLKVLEIGCGSGNQLGNLIKFGFKPKNLMGIDLQSQRISVAKKNYSNINFKTLNALNLDLISFKPDVILMITFLSSVPSKNDRIKIFRNVKKLLNDHGVIIVVDFFYKNPFKKSIIKPINFFELQNYLAFSHSFIRCVFGLNKFILKVLFPIFGKSIVFFEYFKIFNQFFIFSTKKDINNGK